MGKVLEFPSQQKITRDLHKVLEDFTVKLETAYNVMDEMHKKLAELETELSEEEEAYNKYLGTYISLVGAENVPVHLLSYSSSVSMVKNEDGTWQITYIGDKEDES
tara:strand:- start:707 stop:1024 length:318 start_codon:yes stop_codon:yes gene_type:complete